MQTVKKYPNNTFSWIDLNTTNQEGAKAFYTSLFGWEVDERPIGEGQTYTMFKMNGADVCAANQMRPDEAANGVPSYWTSYITVYDLDKALEDVKAAGGTVEVPPFDVMDEGNMAVIKDPVGAVVALWKAKNHIGASVVNTPNAWTWNELMCEDTDTASAFYETVFGWTSEKDEPANYISFKNNGRFIGGLFHMEGIPPHWSVYFGVENCEVAVEKVKELGGSVIREPFNAGETGIIATVADPQGSVINLIQANYYDDPPNA